jgi:hypothetical protein
LPSATPSHCACDDGSEKHLGKLLFEGALSGSATDTPLFNEIRYAGQYAGDVRKMVDAFARMIIVHRAVFVDIYNTLVPGIVAEPSDAAPADAAPADAAPADAAPAEEDL